MLRVASSVGLTCGDVGSNEMAYGVVGTGEDSSMGGVVLCFGGGIGAGEGEGVEQPSESGWGRHVACILNVGCRWIGLLNYVLNEGVLKGATDTSKLANVRSLERDEKVVEIITGEGRIFGSRAVAGEDDGAFVFLFKAFLLSRANKMLYEFELQYRKSSDVVR